ncbi:MAG: RNA 2'-phosphotransferase [Chitinophagaceae bacterium]
MDKQLKGLSKMLSYILRHQPQSIGLSLNEQGWANVEELITKMKAHGTAIDHSTLQAIVDTNDKKRFAFNEDKTMIRASQGHSVEVELSYEPQTPPEHLYHGTTDQTLPLIMQTGLSKMGRHDVHFSTDKATAMQVGQRHGKPILLVIKALLMHQDSLVFYRSDNGVWLTETVPPQYIEPQI